MDQQRTRELTRHDETAGPETDPFDEPSGDLQQQAAAYANIARQARQECETGADAEKELQRRRNRSGQ